MGCDAPLVACLGMLLAFLIIDRWFVLCDISSIYHLLDYLTLASLIPSIFRSFMNYCSGVVLNKEGEDPAAETALACTSLPGVWMICAPKLKTPYTRGNECRRQRGFWNRFSCSAVDTGSYFSTSCLDSDDVTLMLFIVIFSAPTGGLPCCTNKYGTNNSAS